AETRPDLVVVKHMTRHLRGRAEGEVVRLIDQTLRQHGLASSAIQESPSELEAARDALTWAQPGDLLLLLCHAERDEVLELLQRLQRENWQPGSPLP
ncbi:MAG TPA: Mur ligase, partial [Planctomycetota bacterium]|nr:Mur ligase [Planctomycetota bacterium]